MTTCTQCGSAVEPSARCCPECGSMVLSHQERLAPACDRAQAYRRWIVRAVMALVVLGGVFVFANQLLRTYHPVIADQPVIAMTAVYSAEMIESTPIEAKMAGPFIAVSINDVKSHRLVRFFDPEAKQEIPLMAYITPTGRLVTAMSISEHCGSRDFYLQGNDIHCAQCASYWNMSSLEAYACCARYYPDPIPSVVVGEEVRIDAALVRQWQSRL